MNKPTVAQMVEVFKKRYRAIMICKDGTLWPGTLSRAVEKYGDKEVQDIQIDYTTHFSEKEDDLLVTRATPVLFI